MTSDKRLYDALRQLESKTKNLSFPEAIEQIDLAIEATEHEYFKPHFIIQKANALWLAEKREQAIAVLEDCSEKYSHEPSATFYLGQYLVELGEFKAAERYLTACINASKSIEDNWYIDSAYLLQAYAAARIGNKDLATQSLVHITDDDPMSWIDIDPPISRDSILKMIA